MDYERIDNSKKFDGPVRESHEFRYKFANKYIEKDDSVIDAGCGVGYGKDILKTENYTGVDKNPANKETIKIDFEKSVILKDPNFDVFVGFEIIEHLNDAGVERFVDLAKQSNKYIIVSTPIVRNGNKYHKQQFTEDNIKKLFIQHNWKLEEYYIQNKVYGIFIFKRI